MTTTTTPAPPDLPAWAAAMRDLFRSGSAAQFILHGNVFDVVPTAGRPRQPLAQFLDDVMFAQYDVVLHYDRSRGVRPTKGADDWGKWMRDALGAEALSLAQLREPGAALELIDRYLLRTMHLASLGGKNGAAGPPAPKIAVVIDFAEFVVPRGDATALGGSFSANVVRVLGWANDPAILHSNVITVLVSEGLHDLNQLVVDNPHVAALHLPLPDEAAMTAYVDALAATEFPDLAARSEVSLPVLARRLTGLSRVGARTVLALALKNDQQITAAWLAQMKKEMIERECQGLLEFLESTYTLEHVAGLESVKTWLREDAQLLKRGVLSALPMGYLIAGRIGTGKTFLVRCWAGELGIPCVVLKNFRDRWVGATESNLEKIFAVLRAVGQVLVFVDEADQAAGRREGGDSDSGLSGRVYSMLAAEMSDTRNRGRIIWVFATSRPDLLEVDLKRQGRLDVHIPLFPPQTADEMRDLLVAVARKLEVPVTPADLPRLDPDLGLGGHELEGILVRALRQVSLMAVAKPIKDVLREVFAEVRPSAYTRRLEYMDLVAVKECTDARFLPARFRSLAPEELEDRLAALRRFIISS